MVQKFVKHTEVVTKEGECKVQINIQLDINLNERGISAKASPDESDDPVNWAIPDFTTGPKIEFGK